MKKLILTVVKEEYDESHATSWIDQTAGGCSILLTDQDASNPFITTTEMKGFHIVKQPSNISNGTCVLRDTLTTSPFKAIKDDIVEEDDEELRLC